VNFINLNRKDKSHCIVIRSKGYLYLVCREGIFMNWLLWMAIGLACGISIGYEELGKKSD